MMRHKNRVLAWVVIFLVLAMTLCGCEGVSSIDDSGNDRTKYLTLEQDVTIYKKADEASRIVETVEAGRKLTYTSTKQVDGVKWYKTEQGWFNLSQSRNAEMEEPVKGNVMLAGYAMEALNLFSKPVTSAVSEATDLVIGTLKPGSYVEIYQIRDIWGQTTDGWVALDKIYIPGRTGVNPGWCVALTGNIYGFEHPAFDSTRLTKLKHLQRVKFYERIDTGGVIWGYTDLGWVCLDDTYIEGTVGSGACTVKVIDKTPLNVRIGPATDYDVVRTIDIRSQVEVLYQLNDGSHNWGFVGDGWIYMDLTEKVEA